jgi:Spy/CpxP family protein refolding chaperone
MSTYPTRLTAKATTRRIIVAAILSPAAALLVLSPSANAADQVAINGQVKDSIVNTSELTKAVKKQDLSEAADAKIRNLAHHGYRIRCFKLTVRHHGHIHTRTTCRWRTW